LLYDSTSRIKDGWNIHFLPLRWCYSPKHFFENFIWCTTKLVGPFLGPRVEVGLTPNFMKSIHIFPFSIVGSFFFFFLPSKLDVQCMVIVKKEQNKILFQNPFKFMFNKYNKQFKVGEGHFNSYFYKNQNFIRCVMILKLMCVLILWLVLEVETPNSN
jgi:hypothetical protein